MGLPGWSKVYVKRYILLIKNGIRKVFINIKENEKSTFHPKLEGKKYFLHLHLFNQILLN